MRRLTAWLASPERRRDACVRNHLPGRYKHICRYERSLDAWVSPGKSPGASVVLRLACCPEITAVEISLLRSGGGLRGTNPPRFCSSPREALPAFSSLTLDTRLNIARTGHAGSFRAECGKGFI